MLLCESIYLNKYNKTHPSTSSIRVLLFWQQFQHQSIILAAIYSIVVPFYNVSSLLFVSFASVLVLFAISFVLVPFLSFSLSVLFSLEWSPSLEVKSLAIRMCLTRDVFKNDIYSSLVSASVFIPVSATFLALSTVCVLIYTF